MSNHIEEGELKYIPIAHIVVPEIKMRGVQTNSQDYLELCESVAAEGVNESILVSPLPDGRFELVNGLQRMSASILCNRETIPALVREVPQLKRMSLQIQTNLHKVETKLTEYAKMLREILQLDPNQTVVGLAKELKKETSWIYDRLGLKNLLPEVSKLVDENRITASNAIKLSKLPQEEQPNFVERAMTLPVDEFLPEVDARLAEIKQATAAGREAKPEVFTAIARLRSRTDLIAEHEQHTARAALVTSDMSNVAAFDLAVAWVLQLDTASVEIAKAKWDAQQAELAAKRAKSAEAREAKKAAKVAAAEATLAAATA